MCAGVQNVSRPMVECHEMSHRMPTTMHVAAKTTAWQYHGVPALDVTLGRFADASALGEAMEEEGTATLLCIEVSV